MNGEDNKLDIGWFELCLNVSSLATSLEFYKKLGFHSIAEYLEDRFAIVSNGDLRIGLFEGHIKTNMLNFRGADVFKVAVELDRRGFALKQNAHYESDGSASAELIDPDGNVIYFNTFPGETKTE